MNDQRIEDKGTCYRSALLLGGGGARAAYQVGVLKAIAEFLPEHCDNPFPIICGTSAGSINTAALASYSSNFKLGVDQIHHIWSNFQVNHVFHADGKSLFKRIRRWAWTHLGPGDWQKGPRSLLDNSPLRELLVNSISFDRINQGINDKSLHAYCITACSYTSGESITFYEGDDSIQNWQRNRREGTRAKIGLDHLMASSAIPVIFPSVKLGDEFYGDGSMRQISPISPALHLGADKILIIGLRMVEKTKPTLPPMHRPSLGQIAGYVLDTLFLNSLQSDIERMERMNRTLEEGGASTSENLKVIEHLVINPSEDISNIAMKHFLELPKAFRRALKLLGMAKANSRRFISYLMFTESFCTELIELGYKDAMAMKPELERFLEI